MTQTEFNKRYNITEAHLTGKAEYSGSLYVRGCDLKGITLPTTIGGYLDVSGCDLKGITLPTTIGGSLYVRGCDLKGITLPTTIGGSLDVSGCDLKGITLPTTIGGSLYVRGCDLKGITLPTTIGGSLYVSGCDLKGITLPTTIGGSLYVSGCDLKGITLPTTIGGSLHDNNGSTYIGAKVPNAYFFTDDKYATIDGMFCEIISKRVSKKHTIYTCKKVAKPDVFYIANEGDYYAHGTTVKQAITDLQFKIVAEKLQKDPIQPDTMFTVMYYRTLTGACDLGCRDFMERNGIPYKVEGDKTVEVKPIAAKDLLPILEKSNAYGVDKFKQLITF